jgi:hypothetical protein
MSNHRITNVADGIEATDAVTIQQIQTLSDDVFLKDEYISVSNGVEDAAKPIILNEHGLVDPTMIAFNALYVVGSWTPQDGAEYPDLPTIEPGYAWRIEGVGDEDSGGYTFQTGDLAGKTAYDGDWIIYGQTNWFLSPVRLVPEDYYRVDGTNPITADFNAGGHRIAHIADAVNDDDAPTLKQLNDGLSTKAPSFHMHSPSTIEPQGAGSGLDADTLDGYDSTDFMLANSTITPGRIQPQGSDSGLDADLLDGIQSNGFYQTAAGIPWDDINNAPSEFPPPVATQQTIGGIRIWADGDILNIETTDYIPPREG